MPAARPLEKPLTLPQILRFWGKVDKSGDCWEWTGRYAGSNKRSTKNPVFVIQNRNISPRRVAWELAHLDDEPLSPKVRLLARCRNYKCVNPEHVVPVLNGGTLPLEKCRRGLHDLVEGNLYWTSQGKRACAQCIRDRGKARRKRYLKEGRGWGRSYSPQKSTQSAV